MALPAFLSTLPRSATRTYGFIRSGLGQGLSQRQIHRSLLENGFNISRRTVNTVSQGIRGVLDNKAELKFVGLDKRPAISSLTPTAANTPTKFSFTVRVEGIIAQTGERFTQFNQVLTDKHMTRGEIEQAFAEHMDTNKDNYDFTDVNVILEEGFVNPARL